MEGKVTLIPDDLLPKHVLWAGDHRVRHPAPHPPGSQLP
jgi:hypothetical protein